MPAGQLSSSLCFVVALIHLSLRHRVVVYSPQIVENYELQSGEGLSVFFVLIWLIGDLTNLFGAILAGLLPTIIILASYVRVFALFNYDVVQADRKRCSSIPFAT